MLSHYPSKDIWELLKQKVYSEKAYFPKLDELVKSSLQSV